MLTSQHGISHIMIYPTIVHRPQFQLNPVLKKQVLIKKNKIYRYKPRKHLNIYPETSSDIKVLL